jgi:hypothetical protein
VGEEDPPDNDNSATPNATAAASTTSLKIPVRRSDTAAILTIKDVFASKT